MVFHLSSHCALVLKPDQGASHEVGLASGKPSVIRFDIEKTWTILHTTLSQRMFYGQPSFQVPWRGQRSELLNLCLR